MHCCCNYEYNNNNNYKYYYLKIIFMNIILDRKHLNVIVGAPPCLSRREHENSRTLGILSVSFVLSLSISIGVLRKGQFLRARSCLGSCKTHRLPPPSFPCVLFLQNPLCTHYFSCARDGRKVVKRVQERRKKRN